MATEISRAIHILRKDPAARAIIDDALAQLKAENDRHARSAMVHQSTYDGPTDLELSYAPKLIKPLPRKFKESLKAGGMIIPSVGNDITDGLAELIIRHGMAECVSPYVPLNSRTEQKTSEYPMPDKPSAVKPMAPGFGATGNNSADYVIGNPGMTTDLGTTKVSKHMADALKTFFPEITVRAYANNSALRVVQFPIVASDDIWTALETVMRNGWHFPTSNSDKTEWSMTQFPFTAVVTSRSIRAAHKIGATFRADLIPEIIGLAVPRAYASISAMLLSADPAHVYSHDGTYEAPIGEIAGVDVLRSIRCGQCHPCNQKSDLASRYNDGSCMAPRDEYEFTDAQRHLSRAIYASAAAVMSEEKYSNSFDDPNSSASQLTVEMLTSTIEKSECGHGSDCTNKPCRAYLIIHSAIAVAESIGMTMIGKNGRPSRAFLNLVCAGLSTDTLTIPQSEQGRKAATEIMRAVLGNRSVRRNVARRVTKATGNAIRRDALAAESAYLMALDEAERKHVIAMQAVAITRAHDNHVREMTRAENADMARTAIAKRAAIVVNGGMPS